MSQRQRFEWVTTSERESVWNRSVGEKCEPLFASWTSLGWEIVSVTPIPHAGEEARYIAVGVLRRPMA